MSKKRPFDTAFSIHHRPPVSSGNHSNNNKSTSDDEGDRKVVTKSAKRSDDISEDNEVCGSKLMDGSQCRQLVRDAVRRPDTGVFECPVCAAYVAPHLVPDDYKVINNQGAVVTISQGTVRTIGSDDDDDHDDEPVTGKPSKPAANKGSKPSKSTSDDDDMDGEDVSGDEAPTHGNKMGQLRRQKAAEVDARQRQFSKFISLLLQNKSIVHDCMIVWNEFAKKTVKMRNKKIHEMAVLELCCLRNGTPCLRNELTMLSGVSANERDKCLKRLREKGANTEYDSLKASIGFAQLFISEWLKQPNKKRVLIPLTKPKANNQNNIATQDVYQKAICLLQEACKWIETLVRSTTASSSSSSSSSSSLSSTQATEKSTVADMSDVDNDDDGKEEENGSEIAQTTTALNADDGGDADDENDMDDIDGLGSITKQEDEDKDNRGPTSHRIGRELAIAATGILAAVTVTNITHLGNHALSMAYVCKQLDVVTRSAKTRLDVLVEHHKLQPWRRLQPRRQQLQLFAV